MPCRRNLGALGHRDYLLLDAMNIDLDLAVAEHYRGRAATLHARQMGDAP